MHSTIVSRIAHQTYESLPPLVGHGAWWDHLAPNFSEREQTFALEGADRFRVGATAAIDHVARAATATMLCALAVPVGYNPRRVREAIADRRFYERFAETGDPRAFFADPPADVAIDSRDARGLHFRPSGGTCLDLRFESPFAPVNPRMRGALQAATRNRTAHARLWRHQGPPRATIVAVHGFLVDPYWVNEQLFALPWFYRAGYDVLLVTLPHHGPRQSRFAPFSGFGFFSGGVSGINEAFAQAVYDIRIFISHLLATGAPQVGVTGVSLGGYTAALLAAVDPRLAFAIPNVPVVSIADLMLEWEPLGTVVKRLLKAEKQTVHDFRHLLAAHSPLTYRPALARERLMIIGGVGDRLAPPKHSRLLWDHWERCRIHWFPGSHLIHLDRGQYLVEISRFLGKIGFVPKER